MMRAKKFKELEVLNYIVKKYARKEIFLNPSNIYIISLQHLLETTGSLFESILEIGIPVENIIITGKIYSNNEKTIAKLKKIGIYVEDNSNSNSLGNYYNILRKDCNKLWERLEFKTKDNKDSIIVVLDDGGILLSSVPYHLKERYCIIGIEQTTSGIELNKECRIPIISVAGSAIKRYVEPAFISQAVIQKSLHYFLSYHPKKVGVIGYGNIGKALVKDLSNHKEIEVLVYDCEKVKNGIANSIKFCSSLDELYYNSDMVIGATGKDISNQNWLRKSGTDKVLISVSSGDVEFNTLLQKSNDFIITKVNSILDDLTLKSSDNYNVIIPRGGTPINFDNNKHSVLPEHIQLTRGLLLLGVLQAITQRKKLCGNIEVIKLKVEWQRDVLKYWSTKVNLKKFEFTIPIEKILNSPSFIEEYSQGIEIEEL